MRMLEVFGSRISELLECSYITMIVFNLYII
jgi:hypothetical protein